MAKNSGYHPSSGLHLEEGEMYTIDRKHFSADVFDTDELLEKTVTEKEETE